VKGWIKTFGPVVQGWLGNQVYIFVTDSGVAEVRVSFLSLCVSWQGHRLPSCFSLIHYIENTNIKYTNREEFGIQFLAQLAWVRTPHFKRSLSISFLFPVNLANVTFHLFPFPSGQKWHERRKLLTPAFHYQILDHFIEIFNEQSSILIEILGSTRGKTIDVYPYITKCALDIICGKILVASA